MRHTQKNNVLGFTEKGFGLKRELFWAEKMFLAELKKVLG